MPKTWHIGPDVHLIYYWMSDRTGCFGWTYICITMTYTYYRSRPNTGLSSDDNNLQTIKGFIRITALFCCAYSDCITVLHPALNSGPNKEQKCPVIP